MKRHRFSPGFLFQAFLFLPFLFYLPALHAQEDTFTDIPLWRQALGGAVIGDPVAQVESVVAVTDGGNLKSFSSQGTPLWEYFARGRITPHVSRSREGTSYICRTNGHLIAVNRSGRELWQVDLQTPLAFPVLIGWDGRLFVFTEKKITCMTASGYTLWSMVLEKKIALAPFRDSSGGVIFSYDDGEVLRLDPFGSAFSYFASRTPAAAASLEIAGYGLSILLLYEDREMELVYPFYKESSGFSESHEFRLSLRGIFELPSPPLASVGKKDEAAVLMKDGRVVLLSLEKMKILWTGASHANVGELTGADSFKLIFDERGVYVLTKTGVTGFASDGRRLWTIRLRGAAAMPSFGDDGILYSGGADWVLYAYKLEERVRANQRLLYGEAGEGSYSVGNPGPSSKAGYYFRFDEAELDERFSEIRTSIKTGGIGSMEKEYAAWLMETAGSLLAKPLLPGSPPFASVQHRVEAARLLAYIGSRETIPFLTNLFIRESENSVKAAAAEAIGRIGVDPEGFAIRAFENAILPPFRLMDEEALAAVAAATGALCRFSGPPLSNAGVRILTILSGYDRFPIARGQAHKELRGL